MASAEDALQDLQFSQRLYDQCERQLSQSVVRTGLQYLSEESEPLVLRRSQPKNNFPAQMHKTSGERSAQHTHNKLPASLES